MRLTERCKVREHYHDMQYRPANFHTSIQCYNKLGQLEDIEELVNIPFAKISNLKVGDVVYFKMGRISEGEVININYEELIITILDKERTVTDFMLFNQYGKDRPPVHCWSGAWALTKEELEK